jgi:hypothetical protein
MRPLAWVLVANCVAGTVVSLRDDLIGEPFGIATGLDLPLDLVPWGAALAPPAWLVLVLAFAAVWRDERAPLVLAVCGAAVCIGTLAEPHTYDAIAASDVDVVDAAIAAVYVFGGAALAVVGFSSWQSSRRRRPRMSL